MLILGIHSGTHDSTACLFEEYRLLAAVSQERLTRLKGDGGRMPLEAIDECLSIAGRSRQQVDAVALVPSHPTELHSERRQPTLQGPPDRPVADDQDGGAFQVIAASLQPSLMPGAAPLRFEVLREIVKGSQHHHHDPLGDRNIVHAGRVAERHARRNVVKEAVHAGSHGLHYPKILQARNGFEHARAVVVGDQKLAAAEPVRKRAIDREVVDGDAVRQ